jgi:sugar/nucleoside kinase (ribokinase family)
VIVRLEQPLARGDDAVATTRAGAGGQAANVAAWAAALGAEARWIGKRASDAAGALATAELSGRGVELLGPEVDGRTGVVVSLVAADGDRTMASDRGVSPELRPEELDAAWLEGCDVLHVSGYALVGSPIADAALSAAESARAAGARVSVDLASWSAIRDFGPDRFLTSLDQIRPDVVFANEQERQIVDDELPAETWVLKRGADGCLIGRGRERVSLAALPGTVVDSTGAGDAFAAGFLLGGSLEERGRRGLEAAARCVAQLGAMP